MKEIKDMEIYKAVDKTGATITLEWYKIFDDYDTFYEITEKLLPLEAEAFVDVTNDLFDENLNIKQEYAKNFENLNEDCSDSAWSLESSIKRAKISDKKLRIESLLQALKKDLKNWMAEGSFVCKPILVIAKSEENKILGFAMYLLHPEIRSELKTLKGAIFGEVLAILPEAQGQGLSRLLVTDFLKKIPDINRVVWETRLWNKKAQAVYEAFGCKKIEGFSPTGVGFEYFVKK
ncbi:GNAT family N-acetyltransferase [Candidatus Babeliales bacterium]|nr:GNAT family N-acetyltransferase [Candidatus Babeliales bacterium]MCF7899598.1 GNAT family N-acetyltransferase [Candidatus Babeliales bacterium]